jgi:chromosome segregation ATPase
MKQHETPCSRAADMSLFGHNPGSLVRRAETFLRRKNMSSDDLKRNLNSDEEDSTTKPTITAVFRLLREVRDGQTSLNARFDTLESSFNSRFDALESRLARDFAAIDARFADVDARFADVDARFASIDARFAGIDARFASIDARFDEMSDEMKAGFLRLSDKLCDRIDRSRLHAESDYEDLLRRLRKLESKAS